MERELNYENRITKTKRFPQRTTKKLEKGKEINVIRQVCGQTWTRVRVKYYNY